MTAKARAGLRKGEKVLSGNRAAAYGVKLCRPDIICAYPITPQTSLLEYLYQFCADGELDADTVEVEGESSAMGVLIGAAAAGARTFTATSSAGLAFMFEAYHRPGGARLPIVMVIATREMDPPMIPIAGMQDIYAVRDAGWIYLVTENCQEILDNIILAYRLAEDPDVLLPVNVIYDGYYLSHLSERVVVPEQEEVDAFLPPLKLDRIQVGTDNPLSFPSAGPDAITELRYKHCAAMERAKAKLVEIGAEFGRRFGRDYGDLIEEYQTQDADVVLVAMGAAAGTAKVAVDRQREKGVKAGAIKVRMFRPFPRERLVQALAGKKAVGVLDKGVIFGWGAGGLFLEIKAALQDLRKPIPVAAFIDGLAGTDVTVEHLARAIDITHQAAQGQPYQEVTWLALE